MKTCYYSILGVAQTASHDDIKKAFRQQALLEHPDKNPGDTDEATVRFQSLQEAYECLSNKQDRAWYDAHRLEILTGGEVEGSASSQLNLWAYFRSSCFSGFTDAENGFYTVYGEAFNKIHAEELQEYDYCVPSFGTSTSTQKNVSAFYAYWTKFMSRKSFAHADTINPKYAQNRRESRAVAKENTKLRSIARREFSEQVQALATWIKKLDRRVMKFQNEKLQELQQLQKEKQQQLKNLQVLQARNREKQRIAELARWEGIGGERDRLLAEGKQQFHSDFVTCDNREAVPIVLFVCEICNKNFKSEKQYQSHEKSKKHAKNVHTFNLKQRTGNVHELATPRFEETADLNEINGDSFSIRSITTHKDTDSIENPEAEIYSVSDCSESEKESRSWKSDSLSNDTDNEDLLNRFANIKIQSKQQRVHCEDSASDASEISLKISDLSSIVSSNQVNNVEESSNTFKGFKKSSRSSKAREKFSSSNAEKVGKCDKNAVIPWTCEVCSSAFNSRNKLFQHINKEGHAIIKPQISSKKKKKNQ
ncbi:DnaJ domain-containing protein [Cardiosporidium cionae]|uniref:DnaJ domain-containing protein n=1 Tax=Cardiosporidium cionae TaxID=476202 RepID=A0ABQ7JA94_9APIC|nr:DnaJ domain-containing protein [Cardiosporidium cionae]|eukprot:KAF8820916.1 DnaJ domain-containing protein [Cardiosporidium cionae]